MRHTLSITTNAFDWCLKVFVLLLPIIWLPGIAQKNLQLLFFNYGAITLFGLSMLLPARRRFTNYNIPLLLLFVVFLSLFRNSQYFSISFLNLLLGCLLYYVIVVNTKDIKGLLKCFRWVVGINLGVMLLQVCGIEFLYNSTPEPLMCGFMAKNNHLAMFLGMVAPLTGAVLWPLIGVALIILKCYTGILAYLIGILVVGLLKLKTVRSKGILIVAVFVVILYLASFLTGDMAYKITSRVPAWTFIIKDGIVNPFLGSGLDSYAIDVNMLGLGQMLIESSYSEYLRFFKELGPLPVIFLLWSLIRYYKNLFINSKLVPLSITLGAIVISFSAVLAFQDPLHIPRLGVPMLFILALFEANLIDNQKEEAC